MSQSLMAIDSLLELLSQVPITIREATSGLTNVDLGRRAEHPEWSANEILAHLRASASVHGDQRIVSMLADNEPTIRTVSPRQWRALPDYLALPFSDSFAAYLVQRERLLDRLHALQPVDWQRGANLTGIRPSRYETVHSEANLLVRHEVRHLAQFKRQIALLRDEARSQMMATQRSPNLRGRRSMFV